MAGEHNLRHLDRMKCLPPNGVGLRASSPPRGTLWFWSKVLRGVQGVGGLLIMGSMGSYTGLENGCPFGWGMPEGRKVELELVFRGPLALSLSLPSWHLKP